MQPSYSDFHLSKYIILISHFTDFNKTHNQYSIMKIFTKTLSFLALALMLSISINAQGFDGYALYNNLNSNTSYLIDKNGDIAHTWNNARAANYAMAMKPDGNIVRGAVYPSNQINGAAVGGMLQEIDPAGEVVWEFIHSTTDRVTHHDIALMPNGNVLMIAWFRRSQAELEELGYTGSGQKYSTNIIEVSPDGAGGAGIIWEWHITDHFVQNVDTTLSNYGSIADHPELLNINVQTSGGGGGPGGGADWFHCNGIDYNPDLDQIAFSSRFLSEVFIIDHSTTTDEAAGHTGGNSGKGGDFLYRWGNPSNYDTPGNKTIAGAVHDARWITNDGRPNAGYLQFFNNSATGTTGGVSAVDAVKTPLSVDGYNYDKEAGVAYGPEMYDWRHECEDFAWGQSASDIMKNGNVFVAMSGEYMYEANQNGNIVWQYNAGPAKAFRYECDHPGIIALTQEGIIENLCMISSVDEALQAKVNISPNPSSGLYQISGLTNENVIEKVIVFDLLGQEVEASYQNSELDLTNNANGMYYLNIQFSNSTMITKKISLVR